MPSLPCSRATARPTLDRSARGDWWCGCAYVALAMGVGGVEGEGSDNDLAALAEPGAWRAMVVAVVVVVVVVVVVAAAVVVVIIIIIIVIILSK